MCVMELQFNLEGYGSCDWFILFTDMLCFHCKIMLLKPERIYVSAKLAAFHSVFSSSRFSVLSFLINKLILHCKRAFVIMNDV